MINSAASISWDFLMDWGLFGKVDAGANPAWPHVPAFRLREARVYPAPLYTVFVVVNFVLRVSWSLKLLNVTVSGERLGLAVWLGGEMSVFVFALLEIYRRVAWILLRVEWQWVNHHKMRADPAHLANPEPESPPTSPTGASIVLAHNSNYVHI